MRFSRPCINCDFILGTVAEVELIWSRGKYAVPDHRKKTGALIERIYFFTLTK